MPAQIKGRLTSASVKELNKQIKEAFDDMDACDFCGCDEGDLDNRYPDAVAEITAYIENILLTTEVELKCSSAETK